jgi:hypothetical protein
MQYVVDEFRHMRPARWAVTLARRWFGTQVTQAYRMTLLTPAF